MNFNLEGKIALITGGSKGIGLAIKKALQAEGVKAISWSRSEGVDLMKRIPPVPPLDILINNVGGGGTWTGKRYQEIMQKNYGITQQLTTSFLKNKRNSWGRVITISSIYGKESGPNPWFTAAKSAQIAYMKSLAIGRSHPNVTFNVVCPGHIWTGKEFPDNPEVHGYPEDVANLVVFLCSNLAKHINGACIVVDGGESHSF